MEKTEKKPLLILTGPTAVGKTELSLRLAEKIDGEIISADSMQIYKKMNIGTAKIMPEEMRGIPHFLIDVLDPSQEFNVVRFQQMAKEALNNIYAQGKIPCVVGGTGFYIQALLYNIDFSSHESSEIYRKELQDLERKKGKEYLYTMLQKTDPEYATTLHANNVKKVIRALEYFYETGEKLSVHNKKQREKDSPYQFVYFVLYNERKILYNKIDDRVDQMMEKGLLKEVEQLVQEGYGRELVSMQGIGYKEFFDYFDEKISLEEAVNQIKKDTRHFAKRQLTWFRRERDVTWMNKGEYLDENDLLEDMLKIIEKKGIWKKNEK